MNVEQDQPRPAACCSVFDGSPAKRRASDQGDLIVAVDGQLDRRQAARCRPRRSRARPGRASSSTCRRPTRTATGPSRSSASASRCRSCDGQDGRARRPQDRRRASCGVQRGRARPAAPTRSRSCAAQGAEGDLLDLRGNGGGLLREGGAVSSLFIENGLIVSTKGRTAPSATTTPRATRSTRGIPVVVLVDRGSASASEIVTGRAARPRAARRSSARDVRQGRCSRRSSRSRTAARWT